MLAQVMACCLQEQELLGVSVLDLSLKIAN